MPRKKAKKATRAAASVRGTSRGGRAPASAPLASAGPRRGPSTASTTRTASARGSRGRASTPPLARSTPAAGSAARGTTRKPAAPAKTKPPPRPAARTTPRVRPRARPTPAAPVPAGDWIGSGLTEEEQIESAKYLPRRLPPRVFEEERFVFPASYGVNRIRLLVKDPYWLFAHWDIDPTSVDRLREESGERAAALARLTLKVIDAANGGGRVILLPEGARSWYIRADSTPRTYRAELGVTLPSGEFRGLARSNTVATPPVGAAPSRATRRRRFGRARVEAEGAAPTAFSPTRRGARREWVPEPRVEDATTARGTPASGDLPGEAPGAARAGASDAFSPPRPLAPGDRGGASDLYRR